MRYTSLRRHALKVRNGDQLQAQHQRDRTEIDGQAGDVYNGSQGWAGYQSWVEFQGRSS